MEQKPKLAIVGAAGTIGAEVLRTLEEEGVEVRGLALLDRSEAVGEELSAFGEELPIEELGPKSFAGIDVALFLPGAPVEALASARTAGAVVIDASGHSAADRSVPLIAPALNDEDLEELPPSRTVALPLPAAAQLAAALLPLQAKAGIARVTAVSLEPASSRGTPGVEELSEQTVALLNGRDPEARGQFPHRLAFNVVPQVGAIDATGESAGEAAAVAQARRLLGGELPPVALTRVVVPVFHGSLQLLSVATARPLGADDARTLYRDSPGVKVLDEGATGVYPMPMLALGDEAIHVGRIRATADGLGLLTVTDDVYWGVALPAVRLLQLLLERELV